MYYLEQFFFLFLGYIFGLIQTGLIYSKVTHVDLKHSGSGNTGATNTLRVAGKKGGAIVLIGDMMKCAIPCIIAGVWASRYGADYRIFMMYAGIGAILGHMFPFFLKFKGGKGVACTAAMILCIDPVIAIICAAIFFIIAFSTGYVSLSSLVGISCIYIFMLIRNLIFPYGFSSAAKIEMIILGLIMVLLTFYGHRTNIQRLKNGTENKFGKKN